MQPGSETMPGPHDKAVSLGRGAYVYCVADSPEKTRLGEIGIGSSAVYTVPYRDLSAVIHSCAAWSSRSDDQEMVTTWVIAHHRVVDAAWERWSTVLPMTFGTVIKGEPGTEAERNTEAWLKQEYEVLKGRMKVVRGKAEYGVQVFWDPKVVARDLVQVVPEIQKLDKEIKTKPRGLAYMYRQRLEGLLRKEMEAKAEQSFRDFYSRIRQHAADVVAEKTKQPEKGGQMILNLSCLVDRESYIELGEELDRINQQKGFWVRYTGPWPPYSFVGSAG